jgi:hypothetical protein
VARFIKGDVVVIPFPFSDLSQSKRRPALPIAPLEGDDAILCLYRVGHIKNDKLSQVVEKLIEIIRR